MLQSPINSHDHKQGNPDAPIQLVEYGDYQCPYCGKAYPVVKELQKELGDKLLLVFRNFPLTNLHPDALDAALTAEVADHFGKFWEMHDMLFENQKHLDVQSLEKYVTVLGISIPEFQTELRKPEYEERVKNDLETGLYSGVNGTPTFYVNGVQYPGNPYSVDEFSTYLLESIQ